MNMSAFKEKILSPERKAWVRIVEGFLTLLPAWTSIILVIEAKGPIEIELLKYSYWGSVISCPIIAFLMYRKSDIKKIERLAIIALMVSASFAILVASIESQNMQ